MSKRSFFGSFFYVGEILVFGKHINKYYIKYGWMLLIGILALVVVDVGQLKVPEFYRLIVNGMNTGKVDLSGTVYAFDMDFLLTNICRPLIIVVFMMVSGRFAWRVCFFGAAVRVERDLRQEMFDRSKELSQSYYQINKVGDLMSLFTNDLETVQDCYGNGVLSFCDALFLGGLALYKMIAMNPKLTLFAVLPMIFLFFSGRTIGKYMTQKWDERQEKFSLLSDFSQESFSGIAVIKAFAKEGKELLAFKKLNKENEKVNVAYTKLSTLLNIFVVLFVESVVCVILGYGGYLVHKGVFNAGEMVEFIGYFTAIVWPIEAVAILIEMTSRAKASLNRISELLDADIDVKDKDGVKHIDSVRGEIEFKHLNFTHPHAPLEALHDISFHIKAGENIGIIGPTGSGKTTISDLITRTYNVPDNTLFIDGNDVNDISIKDLRKHIAYVPQDNFLFSESIADNITFAEEGQISKERIEEVSKYADIYENIMEFPDKFDTVLGERGVTVSGGQKQRISIARALMKDAEILIMDDSVSAVDTKTEKRIIDSLKKIRKGKTTLLVAHRISTVEKMDRVLFIDDGKVLDFGTHEELLKRCEKYAETVRLQALEDEERGEK